MSVFSKIVKGAARVFVKQVTTLEQDKNGGEEEVTRTRAREGVKGAAWIGGFLLLWHFILQPVLTHHFPGYDFPTLDFSWLAGLFMGL